MEYEPLKFLSVTDQFAAYRPVADVSFGDAVDLIDSAIRYCHRNGIDKLLVNITLLTGFPAPTTAERFMFAKKWAATADGNVVLSMVAPPEMIDPHRIGVTMGANRGLSSNVFADESEAIRWLMSQTGP